ncbi:MAG: flagellar protein FlaG [Desulfitobacterium sp.]
MDMIMVKATAPANSFNTNSYSSNVTVDIPEELSMNKPTSVNKSEPGRNQAQSEDQGKEELTREDVAKLTEQMNKIMKTIDADLQFEMHEETKRLMVRFINNKNHQVIKEFPPKELLDTLAAIQDYVGILLDKKV